MGDTGGVGWRDGWRPGAVAAGVAAYSWWATGLRSFTWPALVAVLGAGSAAAVVGARLPPVRHPHIPPTARTALWAVVAVVAGWQLAAYLQHPRAEHPTLSVFANRILDPHPVRALGFLVWLAGAAVLARFRTRWPPARWALLAGWLWLGWHLFVRASR